MFYKGNILCDFFLIAFLYQSPSKKVYSKRKEFTPRANSFLFEQTSVTKGDKTILKVTSPECLLVSLKMLFSYWHFRKMRDGELYVDSVPFSCCSVKARLPCVVHHIAEKLLNNEFDDKTLYQIGCTDTLMDELANKLLYPAGCVVLILFGIQVLRAFYCY